MVREGILHLQRVKFGIQRLTTKYIKSRLHVIVFTKISVNCNYLSKLFFTLKLWTVKEKKHETEYKIVQAKKLTLTLRQTYNTGEPFSQNQPSNGFFFRCDFSVGWTQQLQIKTGIEDIWFKKKFVFFF